MDMILISGRGVRGANSQRAPALSHRLAKALDTKSFASALRLDRTLTREGLVDAVNSACGLLSRAEARDVLEITLDEIVAALLDDGKLKLSGFGAFHVLSKRERAGRNPRTGVAAKIDARRVVTFTSSPVLRARLNGEPAG